MELIDVSVIDKFNTIGGAFVLMATYIFGEHWILFAAFLILNIVDYITGVLKSKILKTESSSAGLKGIVKKFMNWIMIMLGFGLIPIMNEIGAIMDLDLSMLSPVFGWYLLAVLAINEVRSILENIVECGYNVPAILIKGLAVSEKLLKSKEDLFFDGDLSIDPHAEERYKVNMKTSPEELETKDMVTLRIRTTDEED